MRRSLEVCRADDSGSVVPLILGCFLLAMVMVAGSVAAGDAFLRQRDLQSLCDSAAAAAVSSVDLGAGRGGGEVVQGALRLADVQRSVDEFVARDVGRADLRVIASLSAGDTVVSLECSRPLRIAFASVFARGGKTQRARSVARAPVSV